MTSIEESIKVQVNHDDYSVDISGQINLQLKLINGTPLRLYKLTPESSRLLNKKANLAESLHILHEIALQSGYSNQTPSEPE